MKKLWGGRFKSSTNKMLEEFTQSISYDKRLFREDILGSIAHATMLANQKIITSSESKKIIKGLKQILKEIEDGKFSYKIEFEDIHMAIEARLKEIIGDTAGKLHTARSRNDQVAVDVRNYLKNEILDFFVLIESLQTAFVNKADKYFGTIAPGYTHLQRAQPVLLSHYLLAYAEMLERDKGRLIDCFKRLDVSPLGSGAMSGTTFKIDRTLTAKMLGFSDITQNSMDAVSDRDFAIELTCALSIIMTHISRFAEDMIIWNSWEFRFVILPDEFCTGSSIMPQKKNPDALELMKGKVGRVYGSLFALLTIMKGIPMTYNRDMQEDKEQIFNAVDTTKSCLELLTALVDKTEFNKARLEKEANNGYLLATEIADYLAKKGVPFRYAHEITGKIVAFAETENKELYELTIDEYKMFSDKFDDNIFEAINAKTAVSSREVTGGTGFKEVKKQILKWQKRLKK